MNGEENAPLVNILIPVAIASVSVIGAVVIWVLNQISARTAATRVPKRELYEKMVTSWFWLCDLELKTEEHTKAIFALDTAWLYASRGVLQSAMNFLKRYQEIRDRGNPEHLPRDDKLLESLLHNVFAEMRKDLVSKPWYTFGLFELPPIRGQIEFYEWTIPGYDGLRAIDQTESAEPQSADESRKNEAIG